MTVATAVKKDVRQREFFPLNDDSPRNTYHHRPSDIVFTGTSLVGTFGKAEVEQSAAKLVRFFQSRGGWVSFTLSELILFYQEHGWDINKMFFGLLGAWFDDGMLVVLTGNPMRVVPKPYILMYSDGQCRVTNLFVEACMRRHP